MPKNPVLKPGFCCTVHRSVKNLFVFWRLSIEFMTRNTAMSIFLQCDCKCGRNSQKTKILRCRTFLTFRNYCGQNSIKFDIPVYFKLPNTL